MPRKGRQVPQGEDRGPRTKAMSVYLTEEEHEILDEFALNMGFQSKASMVTFILENLMKGGFSGFTFMRLGNKFSDLIEESGVGYIDIPLPKSMKERRKKLLEQKKKQALRERRLKEREENDDTTEDSN